MKTYFLIILLYTTNSLLSQVGIGTNTPSANAALDVTSTTKGLMLPRLTDTTVVSNPSAGLMIYNANTMTPAFHDGVKWSSVNSETSSSEPPPSDSLVYTLTFASGDFVNGTFPLLAISNGISNSGSGGSNFQDVSFTKIPDINSIAFSKAVATGNVPNAIVIEIKSYIPGTSTLKYSIKLTDCHVSSYSVGISPDGIFENITVLPIIFGYKDWPNTRSFGWNVSTQMVVPY